jgi:hypothetical protein
MLPVEPAPGGWRRCTDPSPVAARAEIDAEGFLQSGVIRFIFDCGIEGADGSYPFSIDLVALTNDFVEEWADGKAEPGRISKQMSEKVAHLAAAFEAEAARLRTFSTGEACPEPKSETRPA